MQLSGLLIIGGGGHGKVVADAAMSSGWSRVAFLDDRGQALGSPAGLPILGAVSELQAHAGKFSAAVVALGDGRRRLLLQAECLAAGLEVVSIIHPTAFVSRFASLAPGCVVLAQAAINVDSRLGRGCIVNTGATVDHDCVLGEGVHICPGAHLAGSVHVGNYTWVGIGASVREGVAIGPGATVGAGAVVVGNVAADVTVVGVPARGRGAGK